MNYQDITKTNELRAADQHVAHRHEVGEKVFLNVLTEGTVSIREYPTHLWLIVRGKGETTQIMLPITREQLCDLACGLWIDEMAEASDGQG
jgi:hypothetical protein